MREARQKEFFVEERKETPPAKREKKEGGVIRNIPAGVVIYGEPLYGGLLLRRTEEGESFPWRRRIRDEETMTMWYEGTGGMEYLEYLPTVLKRGPLVFVGDLRREIQRKAKGEKLQYELPMPTKEK